MHISTLENLIAPDGRATLALATELGPTEAKYPSCYDRLRKQYPSDVARAALDTVLLRERARAKFTAADVMFFDREALEMASSESVAAHRAQRFGGFDGVADLGCGIGADTIELARSGCRVIAVDRDRVRLRMAEANLNALGLTADFVHADMLSDKLPPFEAAFVDPGRRPGGRRVLSIADYEPPVNAILDRLRPRSPQLVGVKVAPGVPAEEWRTFPGEVEFVSLDGELKECVLWWSPAGRTGVTATVLSSQDDSVRARQLTNGPACEDVTAPAQYLYDPDPAVTRSGLVPVLAAQLGGTLIDLGIAMVTAERHVATPFAAVYRVEDVLPFHVKRVGEWLRTRSVGRVTIVKRGSKADAEDLMKRWKLHGDRHFAVILTRANGSPVAVIGDRLG